MASVDHPLIVDLVATMQDRSNLYMLLNFIQGGELYTFIHRKNEDGVPNKTAQFYAACIVEALNHLHARMICYRDLKPENVLIDKVRERG
jgi:protein kinase A